MFPKLKTLTIGYRMLASSAIGALVSLAGFCLFYLARTYGPDRDVYLQGANVFEIIIMIGSYAALIMLVLGVPLFLIALLMGHMFEEKIERRPAVWCLAAPVVAWILVTAVFTVLRFAGLDFAALGMRFLGGLTDGEALSVLLGCIPPAATFYWLTVSQPKP